LGIEFSTVAVLHRDDFRRGLWRFLQKPIPAKSLLEGEIQT
jgi:hypothetical protein